MVSELWTSERCGIAHTPSSTRDRARDAPSSAFSSLATRTFPTAASPGPVYKLTFLFHYLMPSMTPASEFRW